MTEEAREQGHGVGGMSARGSPPATLQGRWLLIARVAWVVVALLYLGVFISGIPSEFARLQPAHPLEKPPPVSRIQAYIAESTLGVQRMAGRGYGSTDSPDHLTLI